MIDPNKLSRPIFIICFRSRGDVVLCQYLARIAEISSGVPSAKYFKVSTCLLFSAMYSDISEDKTSGDPRS